MRIPLETALTLASCALYASPWTADAQAAPDAKPSIAKPSAAKPPVQDASPSTFTLVYPKGDGTPLGNRITALLATPAAARVHWGIAVTALDGTPLYGLDEMKLFRPASTAKLFTTAAALAVLGPAHTVATEVYGALDAANGTMSGDLVLLGGGDPSFGTTDLPYTRSDTSSSPSGDLAAFADGLVAAGLRHVQGDIVGRDDLFAHEAPPEGWAAEDLQWGYGAPPSALSAGDNQLRVTVRAPSELPLPPGIPPAAAATVDQLTPYLKVESRVQFQPVETKLPTRLGFLPSAADGHTYTVSGTMAFDTPPVVEHLAIADPAQYAAEALRDLLRARGVQVDGAAKAEHASTDTSEPALEVLHTSHGCGWAYPGEQASCTFSCPGRMLPSHLLATKVSQPLIAEITYTLKTSANLHAELLVRQLGLKNACPGASSLYGLGLVRTWALHAGVAPEDMLFYDGSGLSTKDLVTPRAEAQLLAYAAEQLWFAPWKAALPVGGVDGTLALRFTEAPLKGHVFAKTGSLGESRALAGYVRCASGREVIFAILDDDHEPGSTADRTAMDKIVEAIAANN